MTVGPLLAQLKDVHDEIPNAELSADDVRILLVAAFTVRDRVRARRVPTALRLVPCQTGAPA